MTKKTTKITIFHLVNKRYETNKTAENCITKNNRTQYVNFDVILFLRSNNQSFTKIINTLKMHKYRGINFASINVFQSCE